MESDLSSDIADRSRTSLGGELYCAQCLRHPPRYDRARAALVYDGASRDYILGFKHGDRSDLTPLLSRWMTQAGSDFWSDATLIVPVPLHRTRLLRRRFNQSVLLASAIAGQTAIPFTPDLLTRSRRTRSLGGLGPSSRHREVAGAFQVSETKAEKYGLAGAHVVLVDDVLTTGATAGACAKALKRGGAMQVDLITVARVVH